MNNIYYLLHGDSNKEREDRFLKLRKYRRDYIRNLIKYSIITEETGNELMDLIHQANINELEQIDLVSLKNYDNIVGAVRNIVVTKTNIKKRKGGYKRQYVYSDLSAIERVERESWISKTKKLYTKLINENICDVEELEEFKKLAPMLETPIQAERIYLELLLKHTDEYGRKSRREYCSQCPHCDEFKNCVVELMNIEN